MEDARYIEYINNQIKYHQQSLARIYEDMNEKTKINNITDLLEMINQYFDDDDDNIMRIYYLFFQGLQYHNDAIKTYTKRLTRRESHQIHQ